MRVARKQYGPRRKEEKENVEGMSGRDLGLVKDDGLVGRGNVMEYLLRPHAD